MAELPRKPKLLNKVHLIYFDWLHWCASFSEKIHAVFNLKAAKADWAVVRILLIKTSCDSTLAGRKCWDLKKVYCLFIG
jgi:hypothetical protein